MEGRHEQFGVQEAADEAYLQVVNQRLEELKCRKYARDVEMRRIQSRSLEVMGALGKGKGGKGNG